MIMLKNPTANLVNDPTYLMGLLVIIPQADYLKVFKVTNSISPIIYFDFA